MRHPSAWGRRTTTTLLAVGVAISSATLTATAPARAETPGDAATPKDTPAAALGSHDAELLSAAEAKGEQRVTVIIAADKGRTDAVAGDVKKLGGSVTRRVDSVGYVLAQVPTSNVVRTAKLPGVRALDLDEVIRVPKPEDSTAATPAGRQALGTPPGPGTPAANPYLPADEIGAVRFRTGNPAWDGRNITIGVMDSGVDLDHPALQKTTTGERKIVDWVTATNPVSTTEPDATWRPMIADVTGPEFTWERATWKAPAGTWKINRFVENITAGGEQAGDVNRDGDTTDTFGILYDPASHDIRVDANQNLDFTDDPVMRPYRERFDVGHFGTDRPDTPVIDRMAFVVEYLEDVDATAVGGPAAVDYVNIGIVEGMHGSHVAGIAAANDLLGNANFDGVAPGARIVSARACSWTGGCTADALTFGMIDLVVNRKVDVVNMSIGGLPALNDGNNARAELYNRLIEDHGVQMFISAGNSGPGLNTVGDPSVASNVVSVAASVSKETWLANYGAVVRTPNALFNFSSRGPREDGGFKPNITAPGSAISAAPMWQPGSPGADAGYPLPAGYAMANGTSMAAPQATGGAALLLSAARAKDVGVTPAGLRRALYSSARPIPDVSVTGQGYGMMDVNAAWRLLARPVETRTYTSQAPVCTEISDFLPTPDTGLGIHNRCTADQGGHRAGQRRTYTVKLTRTSGPAGSLRHELRWIGNDGTFSSAGSVRLPLNRTVDVTVTARPGEGAHGAILVVDDPTTPLIDFEVLNTVVVATDPGAPAYAASFSGVVDRNATRSFFVSVPKGAKALQVNLSGIATGAQTRFIAINPHGVPVDSTSSLVCYTNFSDPNTCKPQERDYQNPLPGIWEIEVEARRTTPGMNNPFNVTARVQGVAVTPEVITLPSVAANKPTPVSWTVQNQFGPVAVRGQGGPLGSALSTRPTIADKQTLQYTVDVPAGTERLDVAIGRTADLGADLDLAVRLNGAVVAQSADGDSDESVSIPKPAAGTYTVVITGYAVPAGTTQFDYRDVYFSPSLGSVSIPARTVNLASGASSTIAGTVTVTAAPPAGRSLFGEMTVVTDQGAVVGRGAVTIGAVS